MSDITIVSWNIQNGLGTDGERSLARIASVIDAMGQPDVICLQEVSRFMPLDTESERPDQLAELQSLFNGYQAVYGPAYDMVLPQTGERAQYGNLILSRLPVLSRFQHGLPQPARAGRRQMPRQAVEVTLDAGPDKPPLRVMTTHLEFHSQGQRLAQMQMLRQIHEQIVANELDAPAFDDSGPYQTLTRASNAVICGDLNCLPDSPEMQELLTPSTLQQAQLVEVWQALHGSQPHEPTCGIFDAKQWPQGAHCRDFFVVSHDLVARCRSMTTDTQTNASDHQPILLTLDG